DLELIKYQNKLKLIKFLGEGRGKINPHSIFDMQLSIMHESKRQILNAMAIAYQFYYLRDNANAYYVPRTYVFSGKANEGYFIAKETIKFIFALKNLIESDKIIREKIKIIFVEDLSVGDLRYLYPAADVYSNLNHPLLDNQNFNTLNALFNMSNLVTSRGGITENVDKTNDFYFMGDSYLKIKSIKENNFYNANDFIYQNEIVKYTTERLLKESYEQFPYDFKIIYNEILMYNDSFNVFYDLKSLIDAREKISKDYLDKEKWVKQQISNIIWANEFDMDYTEKRKLNFDK
ncbi:glycogen/starch/alpha-glucan phosphorylase, partial [Anaerococcus nagyae]